MTARLSQYKSLVSQFGSALHAFQTSEAKFRILKTVHPSRPTEPTDSTPPKPTESPKTLFILDSSFNPPSIAHQTLALSALHKDSTSKHPSPHRLLLLFATMNADKNPSPAAFEQRLTLMALFACDLLQNLHRTRPDDPIVPIDIGVTKVPYYTDKSLAITADGRREYPDSPRHVHLIGFDTLTRFFNPKYYSSFDPPLSALDPYFAAGHHVRGTLRPDDGFGSVDEQKAFVARLGSGELEREGGKREWAAQVEVVKETDGVGVSSTRIRKAASEGKWDTVGELCTPTVAGWIRREGLYRE